MGPPLIQVFKMSIFLRIDNNETRAESTALEGENNTFISSQQAVHLRVLLRGPGTPRLPDSVVERFLAIYSHTSGSCSILAVNFFTKMWADNAKHRILTPPNKSGSIEEACRKFLDS